MKILIADDDPATRLVLEEYLEEWGYEVVSVADGNSAWNVLREKNSPRLVVLDWMMPGMDGIEICRRVREFTGGPYTYILLLTSKSGLENMVKGMETGADDYIVKPFNSHELRVRLRAGQRVIKLNEELVEARDAFRIQASLDSLTGVLNRGAITDVLKREIERANRDKKNFSLLMLDLDHFKKVNDTYGHIAGDQVLLEAVKRLRLASRPYDSIGRYGGEEFLLVLPGCDSEENAVEQAERFRQRLSDKPMDTSEGTLNVTASFGGSVYMSGKGIELDSFIKQADEALYRAKEGGRNRVEFGSNT